MIGDPQRYHEVNEAFHGAIYAGAHNAYLAELTLATRARVQPFRRAQFRNLGRLAKSHASMIAWWRRSCAATARARRGDAQPHHDRARGIRGLYAGRCDERSALRLSARHDRRASRRNCEMSRAPSTASASTRKPFTPRPSGKRERADRRAATGSRRRSVRSLPRGSAQISTSIARPLPVRDAQQAGLWRAACRRAQTAGSPARSRRLQKARAERAQFAVERHAGQMRADHGDRDFVGAGAARMLRERRQAVHAERAERQAGVGMKGAAEAASSASWPAGASSVTPYGVPSSANRGRHREAARSSRLTKLV